MNVQDHNVGNRGDVVKHVALVALAEVLREAVVGPVRHVETHTFRLHAPLPPGRVVEGPGGRAGGRWAALQAPWSARGRYRCSAGLARDVFGPDTRLVLAEADGPTREALAAALAAEGAWTEVLAPAAAALVDPLPLPPLPLFVHVDPFDHPAAYWPVVEALLVGARTPATPAVVLAFAYDRVAPPTFPDPPGDLVPVGRLSDPPYALAAWVSPAILAPARRVVAELGWEAPG